VADLDIEGLTFALCEATVCGFEFDRERRIFATTLAVLWLPEEGQEPEDLRLQFCFLPVGRLAVSFRTGLWSDKKAPAIPITLQELPGLIRQFGGPIYGDRLFDADRDELKLWKKRTSLDWDENSDDGRSHSFLLFQEASDRYLGILVWFDQLKIFRPDYSEVSVSWVVDGARRWWAAWNEDDARTQGHGIVRLSE
jgi:hypothetical protein